MLRSSPNSLGHRFIIHLLIAILACVGGSSCSTQEAKVKKGIEAYAIPLGAREVTLDCFFISPDFPDKAYAGSTVTYNAATATGGYMTQKIGFIMRRDGDGWATVKTTAYTTEQMRANDLMAGLK
jgi:hypothetical protein